MRLFVALDFPEGIRAAIRELTAKLKPLGKEARWVRAEGMHVTLKFIGHVKDEMLDTIVAALSGIDSPAPVEMRFRGVGFFPTEKRPRVFWCGIEASPNLSVMARDIESALVPLGIAAETRDFAPHLTLARFQSPRGADKLVSAARELDALDLGSARETEFHLFESKLRPTGAEYSKRRSFRFVKDAA